jgi:hypothetical protein
MNDNGSYTTKTENHHQQYPTFSQQMAYQNEMQQVAPFVNLAQSNNAQSSQSSPYGNDLTTYPPRVLAEPGDVRVNLFCKSPAIQTQNPVTFKPSIWVDLNAGSEGTWHQLAPKNLSENFQKNQILPRAGTKWYSESLNKRYGFNFDSLKFLFIDECLDDSNSMCSTTHFCILSMI